MRLRIRDLREDRDLTQKQLSEILYLSQSWYSSLERGKGSIPCEILIKLSKLYGTSVDYLLGLTDNPEPK